MLADRYEVGTTRLFNQILQAGMTVIDVGAHVGYFTLLAARLVGPGGRVYAFEPDPSNYSLLRRNIKLNGYQNITAINQAVSDRSGSGTLFLSGMDTGSHSLFPSMPVHGVEEIPVTTLDTFLDREGWPSIHVVKIDVEGSELSVLAGMAGTLQRNANIRLVIEFCPWILRDRLRVEPCDLLATLRSKKFKLSLIRDQDVQQLDSLDVDGLIRRLVKEATYVNLLAESVG
jgi:FkbM family methyltransferase